VPYIAVASHDTASAVVAVPFIDRGYVYLSSGTWSLMGVEVKTPVINEKTLKWNFTNEGGIEGNFRLLKNIMGLWIVQECKREWSLSGEHYEFDDLVKMAEGALGFKSLIDPDKDYFAVPGNMPEKVQRFCESSGQRIPESKGEIIRCIFESLALKYRFVFEKLEEILDKKLMGINIVGGGANNRFLNQFTANAIKRSVVCGPTEATVIGNLMVQAMALGEVKNLSEIRQVVKQSFETEYYTPRDTAQWDEAYERFLKLM
jgi:sugar (pentulose or hexulose) kinase